MLSLQPSPRNEDRSPGRRAEAPAPPSDSPAVAAVDEEDAAQGAGDAHVRGLAHQHHDGLDELHQQHTRLQQRGRELAEHLFVRMSEGWKVSLRVQGSLINSSGSWDMATSPLQASVQSGSLALGGAKGETLTNKQTAHLDHSPFVPDEGLEAQPPHLHGELKDDHD